MLPAFPFFYIVGGAILCSTAAWWRWITAFYWLLVFSGFVETAVSCPHFLSYYSAIIGGQSRGHEWVLDSNCDWGQDLLYLQKWVQNNNGNTGRIWLVYHNSIDPSVVGFQYRAPDSDISFEFDVNDLPCASHNLNEDFLCISVNYAFGMPGRVYDGTGGLLHVRESEFSYVRAREPCFIAGRTIWVYRVRVQAARPKW